MPFIGDASPTETSVSKILSIISAYRYCSADIPDRFADFAPQLQKQLTETVSKKEPVNLILPAFPFKAPVGEDNRIKTLGVLPDKCEDLALRTLNGLAESIAEVYDGGAKMVIVSDASVYGDILRVSDADAFAYQNDLRKMASSCGLKSIEFLSACNLAGITSGYAQTIEEYSAEIQQTRALLDGSLAQVDLREDENIRATRKHYDTALPKGQDKDAMLKRGKAYAELIASKSQASIRLSIHKSNNVGKITIDLFPPGMNPNSLTPWHAAIAVLGDANVRVIDASKVDKANFELVTNGQGQPWLLREKSPLFDWPNMMLDFEPLFPCGMVVKPREGHGPYKFEDVDMNRVRHLALSTAPLLLRGFTMEDKKEIFRTKAGQLGEIQMWPFGDILEVRENASLNMNNVLTNEAMPFHYDGVFKTVKDDKTGEWISVPPLFQMFRNHAADQQVGGLTLFSSSRNILPLLDPETVQLDQLRKLKWKTFTTANQAFGGQELLLPFIVPHPETGADTFRFHEPWPASKCSGASSEPTIVEVPGLPIDEGTALCDKLSTLMYDRRVSLRHQWSQGDFIFNDNAMTLHTRTAFLRGHRELWRVHVN